MRFNLYAYSPYLVVYTHRVQVNKPGISSRQDYIFEHGPDYYGYKLG